MWTATGSLNDMRTLHSATLLPNGKVLVARGYGTNWLTSAELYDPTSGTWAATGPLTTAGGYQTATLLPNGKVLVASGFAGSSGFLTNAELYDPTLGTWTNTGPLTIARSQATASLLPNGKVLVVGGYQNPNTLTNAEVYDPVAGTWSATVALSTARSSHTATLLANGRVLVAGGSINGTAISNVELFDSAVGAWTNTGALNVARGVHTATLLPNGKVLVAGGSVSLPPLVITNSSELYNPANGTWTNTGALNTGRRYHTATLLPSGKVLVAGGTTNGVPGPYLSSAELYDPANGTWTLTGAMTNALGYCTATVLANGRVLVAGGTTVPIIFRARNCTIPSPAPGPLLAR